MNERNAGIRASGAALAAIAALWAFAVAGAPVDAMQGPIQKILYVHVPAALGAYLGFLTTALCGALYLRSADERFDRCAIAAAEVGVVFCTLNIASGPIWARGTWGHWWAREPGRGDGPALRPRPARRHRRVRSPPAPALRPRGPARGARQVPRQRRGG